MVDDDGAPFEVVLLSLDASLSNGTSIGHHVLLRNLSHPYTTFLHHTPCPSNPAGPFFSFCAAVADVIPDSALNLPRYTAVSAPSTSPPEFHSFYPRFSRQCSQAHAVWPRRISLPVYHISSFLPAQIPAHRLLKLISNPIPTLG